MLEPRSPGTNEVNGMRFCCALLIMTMLHFASYGVLGLFLREASPAFHEATRFGYWPRDADPPTHIEALFLVPTKPLIETTAEIMAGHAVSTPGVVTLMIAGLALGLLAGIKKKIWLALVAMSPGLLMAFMTTIV